MQTRFERRVFMRLSGGNKRLNPKTCGQRAMPLAPPWNGKRSSPRICHRVFNGFKERTTAVRSVATAAAEQPPIFHVEAGRTPMPSSAGASTTMDGCASTMASAPLAVSPPLRRPPSTASKASRIRESGNPPRIASPTPGTASCRARRRSHPLRAARRGCPAPLCRPRG